MIYIALLRAINVGGRNIKMEDLRKLFSDLGFSNVRSYIQTGNVFFESQEADSESPDAKALGDRKLKVQIEKYLEEVLGYEVAVFLRTISQIEHALSLNPFKDIEITENIRKCVVFISAPLPKNIELPIISPKEDIKILEFTDGEALVLLDQLKGRASNPSAFIEKTFKIKATTRFFGTTQKILDAAKLKN